MSAFSKPIVLSLGNAPRILERIPFAPGGAGAFNEHWLQEVLFSSPKSLPICEIDPHAGELIPICMELGTDAGPADILYVTPTGQLVVVETKLWRNPESRREVVAQILDYAKQLTLWSYDDLDRAASKAARQTAGHLLRQVQQFSPSTDEASFVDGVNRSLKYGDFLLVIVGDGIRSGAETLVSFIERYGNLRFGLALVEVAAYRLSNNETLLLPRTLAKTEIIERTVLLGPVGPIEFEQLASSEDASNSPSADSQWFTLFWSEFLENLALDDQTQPLPKNIPKSTNLYFSMPPGGGSAWVSVYIAKSSAKAGVYLSFAKAFEEREEYFFRLQSEKECIEEEMQLRLEWQNDGERQYISSPSIIISDLNAPSHRKEVVAKLQKYANCFVTAFRHRLSSFARGAE